MKAKIFNDIVEEVCRANFITQEELFSKSRKRETSEARHLIFFLLQRKGIKSSHIQRMFFQNGHSMHHTSIVHGVKSIEHILTYDKSYRELLNKIENEIFE
jgi:chromosomal replication initiation ATPase DnaA